MSSDWRPVRFGDVVQFPPKVKMKRGDVYPCLPMEELSSEYKYAKPSSSAVLTGGGAKFEEGDVVFARINPSLENGKIGQAKDLGGQPAFGSTEYFIFRGKKNVTDTDYIYYLSRTYRFRQHALNSMVGASGRQRADAKFVRSFEFDLPPLPTQQKIAGVLKAYDDLIENNLKRIKLLEEMAQRTYEEWFARFRFPGHESTPISEETGLPLGWERRHLEDVSTIKTGKTPSTERPDYYGHAVPFIKTPDLHQSIYMTHVEQYLSIKGANSQVNKYLPKNTVLLACIGAKAGAVGMTSKDSQCNQQINGLSCIDQDMTFYLYFFCRQLSPVLRALGSNGATMTNVSKGKLEQVEIVVPNKNVLIKYDAIARPTFELILNLQLQNQLLKEARDILLPRLMTGVIDVDSLEVGEIVNEG